jgi:transcriptional regulator with XRE-family HTH domain
MKAKRFNRAMENKEIRRSNMLLLVEETPSGTIRELAEICGVSIAYLSQIKSNKTKRGMGDDVARRLERGMKKQPGWMDVQQGVKARTSKRPPTSAEWELLDAYRDCTQEGQEAIYSLCQQLRKK